MATWSQPFSLQGEELSYAISVTNLDSGMVKEVIVNTASYTLTEQDHGQHNCAQYQFTIFSRNGYSRSSNAVSGRKEFPAGDYQLPHIPICHGHNNIIIVVHRLWQNFMGFIDVNCVPEQERLTYTYAHAQRMCKRSLPATRRH